jgi:hypothetical protein
MTIRHKCVLIYWFSILLGVGALILLTATGTFSWPALIACGIFWMAGQLFVIAMIGDGEEGLGIKRD